MNLYLQCWKYNIISQKAILVFSKAFNQVMYTFEISQERNSATRPAIMELQCQGQRKSVVRPTHYHASEHLGSRVLGSLSQKWSHGPEKAGLIARKVKFTQKRTGFMGSKLLGIQQFLISLPVSFLCFTMSLIFCHLTSNLTLCFTWLFSHILFPEL